MRLRSDVAVGQHLARQALSLCRLIKYCKRKYMSQKAYYCQLLLRNQISLVDVRSLQKKSPRRVLLWCRRRTAPTIASLLPHRERLMLASRRVIRLV